MVREIAVSLHLRAMIMSHKQTFQIRAYGPPDLEKFQGSKLDTPLSRSWIVRISDEHGCTLILSVQPPEGFDRLMSHVSTPVVVADMLRPGWKARARTHASPQVVDGQCFWGFRMNRDLDWFPEASGHWQLECLVPGKGGSAFEWESYLSALDAYHRTVAEPSVLSR